MEAALASFALSEPVASLPRFSSEDIQAFIDSREQEYASRLEDEFAARALDLGIDSGILLDVEPAPG